MKKKIQQVEQETDISLLEQYAEKFIKEALISNVSKGDAIDIIRRNWIPVYIEVYPLKEESPKEKEFREKATIFLNKKRQELSSYVNSLPFTSDVTDVIKWKGRMKRKNSEDEMSYQWNCLEEVYDIQTTIDTSFVLETLCAIYKVFSNFDHFTVDSIVITACERVDKIYYKYFNTQRSYVKMVVSWLRKYLSTLDMSEECCNFINSYECDSGLERDVCHLMYLIENY